MKSLDHFRAHAETKMVRHVMLAMNDPTLLMLAAVWHLVPVTENPEPDLEGCADDWSELWAHYRIDLEQLSLLLRVTPPQAEQILARAIALRIIGLAFGDLGNAAVIKRHHNLGAGITGRNVPLPLAHYHLKQFLAQPLGLSLQIVYVQFNFPVLRRRYLSSVIFFQ